MKNIAVVYTQQFQDSFKMMKGGPGTVVMQLKQLSGSTTVQELTSKKLPEDIEQLKEKALKVAPSTISAVKFIAIYNHSNQ